MRFNRELLAKIFQLGNQISVPDSYLALYSSVLCHFKAKDDNPQADFYFVSEKLRLNVLGIPFALGEDEEAQDIWVGFNTSQFTRTIRASRKEMIDISLETTQVVLMAEGEYRYDIFNKEDFDLFEIETEGYNRYDIDFPTIRNYFKVLPDFASKEDYNPADKGIFISQNYITAHSPWIGVVFPSGQLIKEEISVEVSWAKMLTTIPLGSQVELLAQEDSVVLFGFLDPEMFPEFPDIKVFLDGRTLLGVFQNQYVELISKVKKNPEAIKICLNKDTWFDVFKRVGHLVEETVTLKQVNQETVQVKGPNFQELLTVETEAKETFELIINPRQLNDLFKISNHIRLFFLPTISGRYGLVAVNFLEEENKTTIGVGFILQYRAI